MIDANTIYEVTSLAFALPWVFLWFEGSISITRMMVLLFCFDMVLTVEAGLYSNILLIALLHVITIPGFFFLIYLDLIEQHKSNFSCFICSKAIELTEISQTLNRTVNGRRKTVLAHPSCIYLGGENRKAFARSKFKSGIPE
jgi:hypothetical protein